MEYHNDRFKDYSLLVFKNDKLVALLPANIVGSVVYSHQGLSYGGVIVKDNCKAEDFILIFRALLQYLSSYSIENLIVKTLPFIYNKSLSEEFNYSIYFLKHLVKATDSYFVIDNLAQYKPNRNRKRAIVIATTNKLEIVEEGLEFFWESILTKNLHDKFGVKPVHTISEIKLLQSQFPKNIKSYFVKNENRICAGAVLFIANDVVHFQYSSGDEERTETGALDFLFDYIIRKYSSYKYISFGSSSTDKTLKIDKGLAYWKESFGAKLLPQTTYNIDTSSYTNLDKIFK